MKGASMKLALGHFLANLGLLGLGYFWLGIGLGRGSELFWNALIAIFLIAIACTCYGAAFAFYSSAERGRVAPSWKSAARNLLPLAVLVLALVTVYWLLGLWQEYSANPAFTIASYLTLTIRRPVKPAEVTKVLDAVLWIVRWAVLPVILLPLLAAIPWRGWRGFGAAGANLRKWWFWIAAPLLLWIALRLPLAVLAWTPGIQDFALQMVSFLLRALLAYLLFVAGWLVLAFATSAGKPRLIQPSTADSP